MKKAAQSAEVDSVSVIGIASILGKVYYFQKRPDQITVIQESPDGKISKTEKKFVINNLNEKSESVGKLSYLSISKLSDGFAGIIGFDNNYYAAISKDGFGWELKNLLSKKVTSAYIAPLYLYKNKKVIYWSWDSIRLGFSNKNLNWDLYDDPIYKPQSHGNSEIEILNVLNGADSLFVPFAAFTKGYGVKYFSLYVAVFSKIDPGKVSWRIEYPIWRVPPDFVDKITAPLGVVVVKNKIYSFWKGKNEIFSFRHPLLELIVFDQNKDILTGNIKKSDQNPILSPDSNNNWESLAVFNPAALYDEDEKKLHLMYRAVGNDWRSVFGYAESTNGIDISSKSENPNYVPRAKFEGQYLNYNPSSAYTSGPGSGGCEDPRLTKIDGRIYLTYVAYDGWSGPRVALSSISEDDFKNNNWNWSHPVIISKPGIIDKNAVIFPEKINGKYVILHRVFPDILVDFVDSLEFDGNTFLEGKYKIEPTTDSWDSRKIGAGPPPIKTNDGWLLIYHAVDDRKSYKYQIGAMLLGLSDPTKVLCRTSQPIISPTHWYENEGYKNGVVYPCGAALINDRLNIYYGGADTYVCMASAPLDDLLSLLRAEKQIPPKKIIIN